MAVFLWRDLPDHPDWAIADYDAEHGADEFKMMNGTPPGEDEDGFAEELTYYLGVGSEFGVGSDVDLSLMRQWHSIPNTSCRRFRSYYNVPDTSALPLVSPELGAVLREHASRNCQLFDAKVCGVYDPSIEDWPVLDGYCAVVITDFVKAAVADPHDVKFFTDGEVMGYENVRYDESKLAGTPLARDANFPPHILVSGDLAEALLARDFNGLRLVDVTAS